MPLKTSFTQDRELGAELMGLITLNVDAGRVVEFIGSNYAPEEVFDADQLAAWAAENNYVKTEN